MISETLLHTAILILHFAIIKYVCITCVFMSHNNRELNSHTYLYTQKLKTVIDLHQETRHTP